jgi:hypothetical protein
LRAATDLFLVNIGVKKRAAMTGMSIAMAALTPNLEGRAAAPPYVSSMSSPAERQITHSRSGHILTNAGVWSPDGEWIVYDIRSDPAGEVFDGDRIEMAHVRTGEVRALYQSRRGAHCGVATFNPVQARVVFILGPENPGPEWHYSACHRQGVVVDVSRPGEAANLDACDITPPFTPGALRGGSHVHVWDPRGQWVSFTYEDHVLSKYTNDRGGLEANLRNVGVSSPVRPVTVHKTNPRNHDGSYFTVLATQTVSDPQPGSDQISKAFEEGWIGTNGYRRADGTRQEHALAFQGLVFTSKHERIAEVFVVDLPEDLTQAGEGPLQGTETRRPLPPRGTMQRRLTFTAERKFPGLQGPRHWLRSSPDGNRIAFLMKDDLDIVQLWTVSPCGGPLAQLTRNSNSVGSTFTWSPDGHWIAHLAGTSVCISDADTGQTRRLTAPCELTVAPRGEACVFSPDGKRIAYVRPVLMDDKYYNQIFVVDIK